VRGDAQVTVSWAAPASNGGSAITAYTVTSNPGNVTAGTSGATTVVVPGLTNGTAYTFTVSATNMNGPGPSSAPSAAVTPSTIPGAPTLVTGVRGAGSVQLSWVAPASNGGAPITLYTATSSPGGMVTTSATANVTVNGLTNGAPYTFTVTATTVAGIGPASVPSAPITPATVPSAPVIFSATRGDSQATVAWSTPPNGGAPITGYQVLPTPAGPMTNTASTSAVVMGLVNGTSYTFRVIATNTVGPSLPSNPSMGVVPAGVPGPPPAPTAIRGTGQATVSWGPPFNNGGVPVTGYTVRSSPGNFTATTTGALTANVTGLNNGTPYFFTVAATNTVGTGMASPPSNPVIPGADFLSIWGYQNNFYAVGTGAAISRSSGSNFQRENTASLQTLTAVTGEANEVYAVGLGGTALRRSGSTWQVEPTSTTNDLLAVVTSPSSSDVVAVGRGGTVVRRNFSNWQLEPTGVTQDLNAVAVVPMSSSFYAVGNQGTALRRNFGSWQTETTGTTANLNALTALTASDIYAVGANGTVVRRSSSNWNTESTGVTATLNAVWAESQSEIYAAGNGVILRRNGSWNVVHTNPGVNYLALWGDSSNNVFAVGTGGRIARSNFGSWQLMPSPTTENLNAVWGDTSGNIYAAGENGVILRYSGSSWQLVPSGF